MDKIFTLALVTGASSGIGEALCHLLAENGIDLMVTGRNREALKTLSQTLINKVSVQVFPADLSNADDRASLIREIHEHQPDLVINNAGYGLYGDALSHSTRTEVDILTVNCQAVLELSLEAARVLRSAKKEGVIMNVSSVAAFQVFPGVAVYSASKAFVNQFSESFDEEVKSYGIRVLAACPGMVDTNFRQRAARGKLQAPASSHAMTAEFAAKEIWKQIEQQKPIHIFNWKYRLGAFLTRYVLPKRVVKKLLRANIEART